MRAAGGGLVGVWRCGFVWICGQRIAKNVYRVVCGHVVRVRGHVVVVGGRPG